MPANLPRGCTQPRAFLRRLQRPSGEGRIPPKRIDASKLLARTLSANANRFLPVPGM
jgi:hypothetical protein